MINPDHISESLETFYRVKYLFFYAYPGSGINILDPEKTYPRSSIQDSDLGSGAFLTPGSVIGDGQKSRCWIEKIYIWDPGSDINIPDQILESFVTICCAENI
jgi:hypothetical protein